MTEMTTGYKNKNTSMLITAFFIRNNINRPGWFYTSRKQSEHASEGENLTY